MNKNSNLISGIIIGAVAGAAITLFARSSKGRELTTKLSSMASDLKTATAEVVEQEINMIKDTSKSISDSVSELASEVKSTAKSKAKDVKQSVNGAA